MPFDPDGNEITQEDWELCMEQMRADMHGDLGPLTADDLPTEAELLEMAKRHGLDCLPF